MSGTTRILLASASVAGLALIGISLMPQPQAATASTAPVSDTIRLLGLVRDFQSSHPDFGSLAMTRNSGNVDEMLNRFGQPVYNGNGYSVDGEWLNAAGQPISPNQSSFAPPPVGRTPNGGTTLGVRVATKLEVKKDSVIDAFNSSRGSYALRGNYFAEALVSVNSTERKSVKLDSGSYLHGDLFLGPNADRTEVVDGWGRVTGNTDVMDSDFGMPTLELPEDLDGFQSRLDIVGAVTLTGTITPDPEPDNFEDDPALHVGEFEIHPGAVLTVAGDLRIVVDGKCKLEQCQVVLLDDASLTVWVSDDFEIKESHVAVDDDTTSVVFNLLGDHHAKAKVEKRSAVYATIVAPERKLEIKDAGHVFGSYIGDELKLDKAGQFHVDTKSTTVTQTNFALTVSDKIEMKKRSSADAFDSNLGFYSATNSSAEAIIVTNEVRDNKIKLDDEVTIFGDVYVGPRGRPGHVIEKKNNSVVTGDEIAMSRSVPIPAAVPPAVGVSLGDLKFDDQNATISSNARYKKLELKESVVTIVGDVTLRIDKDLKLDKESQIVLAPGASLTLYTGKKVEVKDKSHINPGGDPKAVTIHAMITKGKGKFKIEKESTVSAWIMGARAELKIKKNSHLYGTFAGRKVKVEEDSAVHVDLANLDLCFDIDDTAGTVGAPNDGSINSTSSFTQWFSDAQSPSLGLPHTIVLNRIADGTYEYTTNSFHPVDGNAFGNEGGAHNHHLTYEIGVTMFAESCAGHFLEIGGDGDFFVFIDGQLVIDLAGADGDMQRVDVDRLALDDGPHRLKIFHAQRTASQSDFRLRTNMSLRSARSVAASGFSTYD